jgi:outer membrane protein assembly factor BamB
MHTSRAGLVLPTLGFLSICGLAVGTEDLPRWPQWRGPHQNGVSPARNLPTTWSLEENVVWKAELPYWCGATPIVWDDRVFVMSPSKPDPEEVKAAEEEAEARRREGGRRGRGGFGRGGGRHPGGQVLRILCLSTADGALLWSRDLDEGNAMHMKSNDASPSPVTDGHLVHAVTGNGKVVTLDMDGNEVWRRDLQEDYGAFGLNWGYASSPLLYDGMVIIEVLHGMRTDEPSYVLALDAQSGETVWHVERPTDAPRESPDAYTTPLLYEYAGLTQIVISGGDYVTGHDPHTGEEQWRVKGLNPRAAPNYRIVASPLAVNDMIFAPTRERPLLAIKVDAEVSPTDDDIAWEWSDRGGPDVPTPTTDGEYFYMIDDSGMATCLAVETGELVWGPERTAEGTVSSSPLLADGKIYFTNEEGISVVLKAGGAFELLAQNELDGSYTLSSPVACGGRIYVRTGTHLYCIAEDADSE